MLPSPSGALNNNSTNILVPAGPGKRPRLVLMVPLRRCGSHALRLRLNASSEFHAPYPLHIVDFMPLLPRYGDLENDYAYLNLVVDVVGLVAASPVKWGDCFDPIELYEATREARPRSVHRLVGEMLIRSAEKRGAAVTMDKSLDSVHYAEEMMEIFPDMLIVNVVRDPRAQVSSINRAIIHEFDTSLNALLFDSAQQAAKRVCAKFPDRVLTVCFEHFIADQEAVLRKVCDFMGIQFNQNMLDIKANTEAAKISGMSALWENNRFDPMPENVSKFRKQLPAGDLELVEQLLADHILGLGYQLITEATPEDAQAAAAAAPAARDALRGNAELMAAANARSAAGRTAAWDAMKQGHYQDFVMRTRRADYLASVAARLDRSQH